MKKLSFLFFLATCLTTFAANYYVTVTGHGSHNGTSWENAWQWWHSATWNTAGQGGVLTGDDTVWVAGSTAGGSYPGGSYPGYWELRGNGSSGHPIKFRRAFATNPDGTPNTACTSSPGWNPAFDSQMVIDIVVSGNPVAITAITTNNVPCGSYVTIDGTVTNGIKILFDYSQNTQGTRNGAVNLYNGLVTNFSLLNVQFVGSQAVSSFEHPGNFMLLGAISPFSNYGLLVSNVTAAGAACVAHIGRNIGLVIEHCRFSNIQSFGGADHGDTLYLHMEGLFEGPKDVTIRNNECFGNFTEGFFVKNDPTGPGHYANNIAFYGNIFRDMFAFGSGGVKCISFDPGQGVITNVWIYNNTFADVTGGGISTISIANGGNIYNLFHKNNIYYNSAISSLGYDNDYNWFSGTSTFSQPHSIAGGSADPFQNSAAKYYNIVTNISATLPRDKGLTLGSPFDVDIQGTNRPFGSAYDMGAFEVTGGTGGGGDPDDTTPPALVSLVMNELTTTSATFALVTDELGTNKIVWGLTTAYGSTNSDGLYTTTSSLNITNLNTNTTYNYKVFFTDKSNNVGATANTTFKTPNHFTNLASIEIELAGITAPFSTNGNYLSNTNGDIGGTNSGSCVLDIVIPTAGDYAIYADYIATNTGQNSVFINWITRPNLVTDICDFTNLHETFSTRLLDLRGNGDNANPQYSPKTWSLPAGTNRLFILPREPLTLINSLIVTNVSGVDTNPPTISSFTVTKVTPTGFQATCVIGESAKATINYGTTTFFGPSFFTNSAASTQFFSIGGLFPSTTYFTRAIAFDAAGNQAISVTNTFITPARLPSITFR